MFVLFDHGVPRELRARLPQHQIITINEQGWATLVNGKLIEAAEQEGFEVLLTSDQGIPHQQRIAGRKLAFVVLETNLWPVIREHVPAIAAALDRASPGGVVLVPFPRPPLRRRLPSSPD